MSEAANSGRAKSPFLTLTNFYRKDTIKVLQINYDCLGIKKSAPRAGES